jgi:hypothetical protein
MFYHGNVIKVRFSIEAIHPPPVMYLLALG